MFCFGGATCRGLLDILSEFGGFSGRSWILIVEKCLIDVGIEDVTDDLVVDCGFINLIVVFKGYRSISDLMERQLDELISKVRMMIYIYFSMTSVCLRKKFLMSEFRLKRYTFCRFL